MTDIGRQLKPGDYVLVKRPEGNFWLELMLCYPVTLHGRLQSHPVPDGYVHGQIVVVSRNEVRDHVKTADVPAKIVEDFFRIQPEQDPAFDRAWWDMAAQDQDTAIQPARQTMQTYITTKIIQATPSEKEIDGVLTPGYAVFYPDGYASWCPKAEFERTARPISAQESGFIAGDAQDA